MVNSKNVAIVGCGIFGAVTALRLSELGMKVDVFESNAGPLSGASYNNQNRLHLGFHYPRDHETAKQCIRGFEDDWRILRLYSTVPQFLIFITNERNVVPLCSFCGWRIGLENDRFNRITSF